MYAEKPLLGATLAPSSVGVAAVGAARSLDRVGAQIAVCKADFSTGLSAGDHGGPSILAGACLGVAEAAVFVSPFDGALGGGRGGEDADGGDDGGDDHVGMHVDECGESGGIEARLRKRL